MQGLAHILLVIPDALLRRELAGLLRKAGHDVAMCRAMPEGMRQAVERQPDIIVAVPEMENASGLDAFVALCRMKGAVVMALVMDRPRGMPSSEVARLARGAGAADVVYCKSRPGASLDLGLILLRKIMALSLPSSRATQGKRLTVPGTAQKADAPAPVRAPEPEDRPAPATLDRFPVFLIGCSTGGPKALETVIASLPASFPAALVVAQHMGRDATDAFAKRLARQVALRVEEVNDTRIVQAGTCYIAAGGADIVFLRRGGRFALASVPADPAGAFHPGVDRMVRSAAETVPLSRLRAVLLTGIGQDGAESMAELQRLGVPTIAESAETALVFGMPARLIEKGGADEILPVEQIGPALQAMVRIRSHRAAPDRVHDARVKLARLAQRPGRSQ